MRYSTQGFETQSQNPVVERDEARNGAVKEIINRFFNSSPELLVLNVLENDQIDTEELAQLKKMIQASG